MSIDWKNKTILVTGGTGSFGHAFAREMLTKHQPKKLIIFSRDEMKQWEMKKKIDHPSLRYFIGDVRDGNRLHRAFGGVDIVIHAAAIKIVPTAEYNPMEAVKTNVFGAENIINAAIDNGVQKVLALSTDKAANPINLYGATKLCSEKMFIAGNNYSPKGTRFSVVRYGNVFGSRGSVVPFFKECRKTNIVPITDKRMTRFWISLPEGVDLVVKSVESMVGGEIFIPKLPSFKIMDLAKAICPDAQVKDIGIRPGEKLHETLVPVDDGVSTVEYEDKYVTYSQIVETDPKKEQGKPLGTEFKGYASDTNESWYSVEQLKEMIESAEIKNENDSLRTTVNQ